MKIKKFLLAVMVLAASLVLFACGGNDEEEHEHAWGEGEVTTEASCTAAGVKTFTCECGETKTEPIAKLDHAHEWKHDEENHWKACECGDKTASSAHVWDEGTVTREATCSKFGYIEYACECGATLLEKTDKLDHTPAQEWSSDEEIHWHACICSEKVDAAEHELVAGEVVTPSTCVTKGVQKHTCSVCNKEVELEMELDPENHEVDTPIVKYVNGYKVVTCECGENELSKDAYLTVLHTNKDVTDDLIVPEVNEDGVYSFDFTTPAWGRISLFYAGEKISTETATFVRATGWIDGAYRGSYELYWDADSKDNTVFLSAVGGTYHVSFDPEANEVIVGDDYRIGFSYDGTFYGHPAIEDGVYTIIETFAQWNRVQLFYNNVVLDAETATFTGAISTVGNVNEPKLYFEEGKLFYGASLGKVTFSITYNPETNVVDIQEVPLEDNQARIAKVNADCGADAVAIYTEAGAKLKTVTDATTGATTYVGNGWRLYIVVDAEGRIAYLVQMPPNGYGGPSGTSYYCHSSYTDYTTNPAFNILDGFGPWVSGGFAHNLYEVVVPEGGFGIVAHGAGITELLDALGVGADRADGTVNARNLLASDVRLSYDAKMGVLTVNPEAAAE